MIVVTGATGKLGSRIVGQLLARMSADEIGISVRDPGKAEAFTRVGICVRRGNFAEPDTLADAFEGASQLLIVSSNAAAHGGDPIAQHRAAIDAAKNAGVGRIVYTSHMGASTTSAFPPMHTHAETEHMLWGSGLAWTALRNGFYAGTLPMMIGDAASSGVLAAPEDGPVSWTTHADLAAAAAAILAQPGRFEGPTAPLTASRALDLADVAAILADRHGRLIERRIIPDEQLEAGMADRGVPAPVIAITLAMYRAARAGEFAAVDPTLAELIGRDPAEAV